MSKILGFKIEIEGQEVVLKNATELAAAIRQTNKELKETKDQKAYEKLNNNLVKLKAEQKLVNAELRNQQTFFKAISQAEGSYNRLRDETGFLSKTFRALGDSIPEVEFEQLRQQVGQLIPEVKELTLAENGLARAKELIESQLKDNNIGLANFNRNLSASDELVGEYSRGILNAFSKLGITEPLERGISDLTQKQTGLRDNLQQLLTKYDDLKREGGTAFDALQREITETNTSLTKVDTNLEALERQLKSIKQTQRGAFDFVKGGFGAGLAVAGVDAGIGAFNDLVRVLDRVSDAEADVAKTTGKTTAEVRVLRKELNKIDTITAEQGLLDIAKVGGTLGVVSDEIEEFTKAVDVANVALGSDLGGGSEKVAFSLQKLRTLFKETRDVGIEESFNAIGSTINELSAKTVATVPNLVEFTLRLGQLPDAIKPSIQETLALASATETAGITAETGSRGFTIFIKNASEDLEGFSEKLGLSIQETENLFNDDLLGFTAKFAESLQGLERSQITAAFKELGIQNQSAIQAVGALANNTDVLTQAQLISNQAFAEGTSLLAEFDIKNNNLSAVIAKTKKELATIFTDSEFLETAEKAADLTFFLAQKSGDLAKVLLNNQEIIAPLIASYVLFNSKIALSAGSLTSIRGQFIALNATLRANPILAITSTIIVLIGLFAKLYNENEQFRASIDGLVASAEVAGEIAFDAFNKIKSGISGAIVFINDFREAFPIVEEAILAFVNVSSAGFEFLTDRIFAPFNFLLNTGASILRAVGVDVDGFKDKFVDAFESGRRASLDASAGLTDLAKEAQVATKRAAELNAKLEANNNTLRADVDLKLVRELEQANKEANLLNRQLNLSRQLAEFEGDFLATETLKSELAEITKELESFDKAKAIATGKTKSANTENTSGAGNNDSGESEIVDFNSKKGKKIIQEVEKVLTDVELLVQQKDIQLLELKIADEAEKQKIADDLEQTIDELDKLLLKKKKEGDLAIEPNVKLNILKEAESIVSAINEIEAAIITNGESVTIPVELQPIGTSSVNNDFTNDFKPEKRDFGEVDEDFAGDAPFGSGGNIDKIAEETQKYGSILQDVSSSFFTFIEQASNRRLSAIREASNEQLRLVGNNAALREKIEQETQKRIEREEKRAAKRRKRFGIFQAIINGAIAATQALANTSLPFPASLAALVPVALSTAAQIATINSQSFFEGGFTGKKGVRDSSGIATHDIFEGAGTNIIHKRLHSNEYVVPERLIPKYRNVIDVIEADRLGKRNIDVMQAPRGTNNNISIINNNRELTMEMRKTREVIEKMQFNNNLNLQVSSTDEIQVKGSF